MMDGLVTGACLSHYPGEVAGYVAFRAALQQIVQSYDGIY
jgi:hypothetical protein